MARLVIRFAGTFFDRVESGSLELSWLDRDTARPTRRIASFVVWLFALAMGLAVGAGSGFTSLTFRSGPHHSAGAGPPADSAAVAEAVDRFHRALAAGDSAAALALLAPDVAILEEGGTETLAEYRAHHLPSDIAFLRAVRSETGPVRVVVQGDAAWATSVSRTEGEYQGRPVSLDGAELMVLSRTARAWGIRAIHWSSRPRRAGH